MNEDYYNWKTGLCYLQYKLPSSNSRLLRKLFATSEKFRRDRMFIIPIMRDCKEKLKGTSYRSFDSKDIFSSPSLTRRDIKSKIKRIVVPFSALISSWIAQARGKENYQLFRIFKSSVKIQMALLITPAHPMLSFQRQTGVLVSD